MLLSTLAREPYGGVLQCSSKYFRLVCWFVFTRRSMRSNQSSGGLSLSPPPSIFPTLHVGDNASRCKTLLGNRCGAGLLAKPPRLTPQKEEVEALAMLRAIVLFFLFCFRRCEPPPSYLASAKLGCSSSWRFSSVHLIEHSAMAGNERVFFFSFVRREMTGNACYSREPLCVCVRACCACFFFL